VELPIGELAEKAKAGYDGSAAASVESARLESECAKR
jgi:hypothetical protein